MSNSITSINPVKIADKLYAVMNFQIPGVLQEIEKEPRLVEALWFLQWISVPENYSGGLGKFSSDFVEKYRAEIGPEFLLKRLSKSELSPAEIESVLSLMPVEVSDKLLSGLLSSPFSGPLHRDEMIGESDRARLAKVRDDAAKKLTGAMLHQACIDFAQGSLAEFLVSVASEPERLFSGVEDHSAEGYMAHLYAPAPVNHLWYFPKLWNCLFDFMDKHAASEMAAFAETGITREIFHWLQMAQETGKGVLFLGNSRFGKSRAIKAFAQMHPGRVRLVECPASGSESDLLREICRALGIRFSRVTPPLHEQRAVIDKVIRSARFLLIFDEAQFLYPKSGNRRSTPPRLNYVRRQLMDNGIPTAFLLTPQNWKGIEKNFLKLSAYTNEQFEGRLLRSPIHLPSDLSEEEMIAVTAKHLPELEEGFLKLIVTHIRISKGDQLSYIENIALISRRYATQRGLAVPRLDDIEKAMHDVLECFIPPEIGNSTGVQEAKPVKRQKLPPRSVSSDFCEFPQPQRSISPIIQSAKRTGSADLLPV
jgi:hypothetical protein